MDTTINIGDQMPAGTFSVMTNDGPGTISADEFFGGKRVLLFSVPGAFTPTCSMKHLPGYVRQADQLYVNGIDTIACTAVNDIFVMDAWGKSQDATDKVLMLADGNGDYVASLGLEQDNRRWGMGQRGQRFSIIANDGVVEQLNVEAPGEFNVSSCEYAIDQTAGLKN